MKQRRSTLVLAVLVAAASLLLVWQIRRLREAAPPAPAAAGPASPAAATPALSPSRHAASDAPVVDLAELARIAELVAALDRPDARAHEAVLSFAAERAYRDFLAHAAEDGLRVLARLDGLRTVRVGFTTPADLARAWQEFAGDDDELAANFLMQLPGLPPIEQRSAGGQAPLGNQLLEFLGVTTDTAAWGRGVMIAIIDTGVAADATFGTGRLRTLDLGLGTVGTTANDGHGTAVAALAAGASADAQGVAPAASVLSIRVTDATGMSDLFTVAQAIVAAVDQGAQILNISLGSHQTGPVLSRAIDYAVERGVVLVAAAGNDQAAQLAWPAADARVVSVGAVDAAETQVLFSNSGPQLQLTAPGYGVQTAWGEGGRVWFDGTSASAPIVAGAIAALMTQDAPLTATQAWSVLRQYASDGGPAGVDPDYGAGVVNLGWALARHDTAAIDTAVSSHYYDAATDTVQVVVQNRSARVVGGLTLVIEAHGARWQVAVNLMQPGESEVVRLPAGLATLAPGQSASFRTELVNPPGLTDRVPANNVRRSALVAPTNSGD